VPGNIGAALQYRAWVVASAVVRRLPARVSYAVAFALGSAAYYAWPRARKSMRANYRRVLGRVPRHELDRTARRSLVNYCKYLADFIRFPAISPCDLIEQVHGEEQFQALSRALERGRGAVIVCMHFGNWDLGAGAGAARGYPLTVVAETFADPRLDAMVMGARTRLGMKIVKLEKAGPSLLRALKENGLLALLIDRPTPGDGVKVTFFGEDVEVPAGPARLALRTGAAVVPTAFARIHPHRPAVTTLCDFDLSFERTGDDAADIQALTQAIMHSHERFIRQYPDQWYMFRPMWPKATAAS